MKKLFLMFILFFTFIRAQNVLWIYTDLNCVRFIDSLKNEYQEYYPGVEIKVLKAPFKVLVKKLKTQKRADLLITDNIKNIENYPMYFDVYYNKIALNKLALFYKKNKKYTFSDVIDKQLRLGFVDRCSLDSFFKQAVVNYAGYKKLVEIKLFKIKYKFKNSADCADALIKNKVDVCIDLAGSGYWYHNDGQFEASIVNESLYNIHYVYVTATKFTKKKTLINDFINFAKRRFEMLGTNEERVKKIDYLFPDLQL